MTFLLYAQIADRDSVAGTSGGYANLQPRVTALIGSKFTVHRDILCIFVCYSYCLCTAETIHM